MQKRKDVQMHRARLLDSSIFFVTKYISLFYLKGNRFFVFNWEFSFMGLGGPINAGRLFHVYYG